MRLTYVSFDGVARSLEVRPGQTVMQAAVANGVPGLIGECGGSAACGTCHVYVAPGYLERLGPMGDLESELLDCVAADRQPNSRLGCQIVLTPELDGLVVHTPEVQIS